MNTPAKPLVLHFHVCLLGPGHVGKSALTLQFMYDEFVEDYEPTKCSAYKRKLTVQQYDVEVDITDTAGQEDYVGINDPHYRSNDGFLVVFSLADKLSLDAVPSILERIAQCRPSMPTPVVLIGNKVDLTEEREVPTEVAIQLAQKWRIPYMETSAKTAFNVERVFGLLINELVRLKTSVPNKPDNTHQRGSDCCSLL